MNWLIDSNALNVERELTETYDAIKACADADALKELESKRDLLRAELQSMLNAAVKVTRRRKNTTVST
jgi:hypothetical protein